ncbi:hypothetical protein BgiBS90_012100, partial [Biomphalaria glabrata]
KGPCSFPEHWRGRWFQQGMGEIEVTNINMTEHGHCVSHDGNNKYLLLNRAKMCYVCLVMTSKHHNLIQYKKSYCVASDTIQEVCGMITGDFPLITMIKVNGAPIQCPLHGQYEYSYTNGSELACNHPQSSIHTCADNSKVLFHFQKCPHISNSHEKTVTFQCLATWETGGDNYMYGRFSGPHLTSKESQYRCFMYSIYGSGGSMSMTADSSCQGLQSPSIGMNVFTLAHKIDKVRQTRCNFPNYFSDIYEWRDVNSRHKLVVSKRLELLEIMDILEPSFASRNTQARAEMRLKLVCIGESSTINTGSTKSVQILTYATDDKCESNYRCIRITHRVNKLIELQIGKSYDTPDNACSNVNFDKVKKQILLPFDSPPRPCPVKGIFNYVHKKNSCSGRLEIGCSRDSEIVVDTKCVGSETADILQCYANWTENNNLYMIAGRVDDLRKSADCLVYRSVPNGHELEADPNCASERVIVLGHPIDFNIKSHIKTCSASSTRTAPVSPAQSQESKETGIYDTNAKNSGHPSSELENPSTGIINADSENKSSCMKSISFAILVGLALNHLCSLILR